MTPSQAREAIAELCDALEGLLKFSRVGTSDEIPGPDPTPERVAEERAEAVLSFYKSPAT